MLNAMADAFEVVSCKWPDKISLETIAPLTPSQRAHLHEIAGRLGFDIGSEGAPGVWRDELEHWWRANGQ